MLILQSNKRFFYKKHIKKYHGSCFWVAFQNDAVLCDKKICQIAEPHYPGPFTMQSYQDRPTPTRTYLAFKQHHGPFPQVSLKVAPHKPSWKTTKTTWWLHSWRPLSAVLKMARTAGQLIGWHRSTTTLASTLHISSPCSWRIRDMWWYAICPKQALTKQTPMRLNLSWAINCRTQNSGKFASLLVLSHGHDFQSSFELSWGTSNGSWKGGKKHLTNGGNFEFFCSFLL